MTKILNVSYKTHKNWSRDILSGSRQKRQKLILSTSFFISLLLIIGGPVRAMAQMKACNFLDPHQNTY